MGLFVGRLSGEEFFIFMPFTSRDVAIDRVKNLKKQIDSHTITTLSGDKTKLTASFAVSFVKDYKQIEKEVEILHQSIAKQQPVSTLSPIICL